MTHNPTKVADFLMARIAEDEAAASLCRGPEWTVEYAHQYEDGDWAETTLWGGGKALASFDDNFGGDPADHIARHDPARVLAECAAKRAIVERLKKDVDWYAQSDDSWAGGRAAAATDAIRQLAVVYADHPDYREAMEVETPDPAARIMAKIAAHFDPDSGVVILPPHKD